MFRRILPLLVVALVSSALTAIYQPYQYLTTTAQGNCRAFPETGKQVCGRFLEYWTQNGGLAQQGLPLSNEFNEVSDLNGQTYTVQYFERAVFEKHPENARPFDVLLSQLGTFQFKRKYPTGDPSGGGQQPPGVPTLPPMPPPPAGEQPITLSGNGNQNTAPFNLAAGNYTINWKASDTGSYGCFFGAFLKSVDQAIGTFETIGNKLVPDGGTEQGTTQAYNVKAGQHYLEVITGCQWEISISRLR